jgi:hypothetical protein
VQRIRSVSEPSLRIGLDERRRTTHDLTTPRLIDAETHQLVFARLLGVRAAPGLLRGKTIGIDATTLEANAALRRIVRGIRERNMRNFSTVWPGSLGSRFGPVRNWRG